MKKFLVTLLFLSIFSTSAFADEGEGYSLAFSAQAPLQTKAKAIGRVPTLRASASASWQPAAILVTTTYPEKRKTEIKKQFIYRP